MGQEIDGEHGQRIQYLPHDQNGLWDARAGEPMEKSDRGVKTEMVGKGLNGHVRLIGLGNHAPLGDHLGDDGVMVGIGPGRVGHAPDHEQPHDQGEREDEGQQARG